MIRDRAQIPTPLYLTPSCFSSLAHWTAAWTFQSEEVTYFKSLSSKAPWSLPNMRSLGEFNNLFWEVSRKGCLESSLEMHTLWHLPSLQDAEALSPLWTSSSQTIAFSHNQFLAPWSKWVLSKDMEQDEKQILHCKLEVQSGQAQQRRKVRLWELRVNNGRQSAAFPLSGDLWGCTPILLCLKAFPWPSNAKGSQPLEIAPKVRIIFLQVQQGSRLTPDVQKVSGVSYKSVRAVMASLVSWQHGWGEGAKTHSISLPGNIQLQRRTWPLWRGWSHSLANLWSWGEDVN